MKKLRRKIQRAFESPKQRKARKVREYHMSVWRTVYGAVGATCAMFSLIISALIFMKVYLH